MSSPIPTFYPLIPTPAQLAQLSTTSPTVYQVQSNLHVPYTMEAAISLERQVTKNATVSLTYLNSRGVHQLFLRNANAPLPGTYNPADPNSGIRPDGNNTNIYQYNSGGVFEQNQLIANFRVSVGQKISLFGFYSLGYANSDLGSGGPISVGSSGEGFGGAFGGGGSSSPQFVMNSYDPMEDYGRASFRRSQPLPDRRHVFAALRLRLSPVHHCGFRLAVQHHRRPGSEWRLDL